MPRTLYARSGDVHLAYQVFGEGPRDIVLVLDWASHLEALWEEPFVADVIASFTRFSRVLWFDMRGIGLSDRVAEDAVAPEEWMEDVGAVMQAAGSARATLVAHGHAAQMALLFAATHPDQVDALVLINGFARLSRADDYPAGMPPKAQQSALEAIETLWGTGAMAGVLGPSVASRPGIQDWYGKVERYAAGPGTAHAKMRAIFELDVRNVLPLVRAPTLVIQNRDDLLVRVEHGRYLAEHIEGARLLERDSADHWPLPDPDLLGAIEEFLTGSRSEDSDADRFLATVLFVDVAGSTEQVSELGDERWQTRLDRFEETVQRVLLTHRGELVNTAGDGVFATFDGPARAIRCACRIRDAVRHNGLEVRCGLHTGEVTRRNDGLAGIAVHIGARVSSAATPGEVLVTRTVHDLVAGSGIAFTDRGEHALKGVKGSWALYAASG
ncbi:MAG: adenylate/guanylate cyclase domain-containing protein [Actinomycetota bacterium]|nr:adenylate/guanylate cyclase domain-containing protein [Actinomycetota bacterium]